MNRKGMLAQDQDSNYPSAAQDALKNRLNNMKIKYETSPKVQGMKLNLDQAMGKPLRGLRPRKFT